MNAMPLSLEKSLMLMSVTFNEDLVLLSNQRHSRISKIGRGQNKHTHQIRKSMAKLPGKYPTARRVKCARMAMPLEICNSYIVSKQAIQNYPAPRIIDTHVSTPPPGRNSIAIEFLLIACPSGSLIPRGLLSI